MGRPVRQSMPALTTCKIDLQFATSRIVMVIIDLNLGDKSLKRGLKASCFLASGTSKLNTVFAPNAHPENKHKA